MSIPRQVPNFPATRSKPVRSSLRLRLILTFLAIAVLPIAGLSAVTTISGAQSSQETTIDQIETVATYKDSAIQAWKDTLIIELATMLLSQETVTDIQHISMMAQPDSEEYIQSYDAIQNQLQTQLEQTQYFEAYLLLDSAGTVILSTNPEQIGLNFAEEKLYKVGTYSSYFNPPYYSNVLESTVLAASYPVTGQFQQNLGVLVGYADKSTLLRILSDRSGLGETGNAFLIGREGLLLAGLNPNDEGRIVQSDGIETALTKKTNGVLAYQNHENTSVVGAYHWLSDLQTVLMVEQEQSEKGRAASAVLAVNASVGVAVLLIALFIALIVTYSITAPLSDLSETAVEIAKGNFDIRAREDDQFAEVGTLASAFNIMTRQLRNLIDNLEHSVVERTHELEERSTYLQATHEVSHATASILDLDLLLKQSVELIRERLDFYYVGLFMADEKNEWAVLKAGTGEAGQVMLSRGHQLPIGRASMIGWSIANAQARIAQEATMDVVRIPNPDLPETQSEAAIPLRSRGQILGAISVQSIKINAFDEATISILQSMADQLAVAIDNARLISASRDALEAERLSIRSEARAGWDEWAGVERTAYPNFSFRSNAYGTERIEQVWYPEMQQAIQDGTTIRTHYPVDPAPDGAKPSGLAPTSGDKTGMEANGYAEGTTAALAIPINVRGTTIGVIDLRKSESDGAGTEWQEEEINFLENIAEQLGVALDSARLYIETQQRAEQERLIGEVTGQIRQSLDVESVLRTAVEEIYQVFGLNDLVIQLTPQGLESGDSTTTLPTSQESPESDISSFNKPAGFDDILDSQLPESEEAKEQELQDAG